MVYSKAMARGRGRKAQQTFVFRTWGGKRRGAGRKQVNERKSQPHRTRPQIRPNTAILVSQRVAPSVRRLRGRDAYRALRKALLVVLSRPDFRVVHISIQANHLHLAVEADSTEALARGMQAFQISAARRLNQVDVDGRGHARRGPVFPDRYYMEVVTGPTHARHALAYVLNNWRKHKEDRAPFAKTWTIDPYSSAVAFDGWAEGVDAATRLLRGPPRAWPTELAAEPLPVARPQTWMLREGWKRGGSISIREQPSRR
jgi:REP element-mobilizing transposase RayT